MRIFVCLLLLLTIIIPLSGETNISESNISGEVLDQKQEKCDECKYIYGPEWQEFIKGKAEAYKKGSKE